MIILSGLFILGIGIVGGYQLATLPKLIEMKQHKAIQNHFNVKGNEYTYYQEEELEVKKELNTLTEQVNDQNKVETFTRFFLTNYYSGKTDAKTRQAVLKKFVKKETLSDFLSEKSRARSMFPWEVKKKDKQWTIAFIVVLINEKDEQSIKKITFTAEETKEQLVVMERPTEEDFELTN